MTTAIRLYRTYILSTFVPLNTIRRLSGNFLCLAAGGSVGDGKAHRQAEGLHRQGEGGRS